MQIIRSGDTPTTMTLCLGCEEPNFQNESLLELELNLLIKSSRFILEEILLSGKTFGSHQA